jgi:hypothetical protein
MANANPRTKKPIREELGEKRLVMARIDTYYV